MKDLNLFTISFLLYYVALFMQQVNIDFSELIKQSLMLISMGCLFLYLCSSKIAVLKITAKSILWYGIFGFFLLISVYTHDFFMLAILLFCVTCNYIKYKNFFKYTHTVLAGCTTIIFVLSLLGILPNEPIVRGMLNGYGYGENRYAFGFMWPFVVPNILVFYTLYHAIVKNKINILDFFEMQFLGICFLYYCDARSGFISLEITLFFHFLCNYINKHKNKISLYLKKIVCLCSKYAFPVIAILSVILLNIYNQGQPLGYVINIALSNRLKWAALNFENYTPHILNISDFTTFREAVIYTLDNGYFYVILRYGYIILVLLSVVCYKLSKYFEAEKNYYGLVAIIIISAMNFIDNSLTSYGFFPLLVVGLMVIKKDLKIIDMENN